MAVCVVLGATLWATPSAAQGADISRAQRARMDDAVTLARDGDLPAALAVYDELLGQVDADILHLNRGRVLQKMGRCWEARDAFDRADQSPRDTTVERKAVETRLDRYGDELEAECPGRVVIQCELPETLVLHSAEELPCDGTALEFDAGKHEIHGNIFGQAISTEVTVRGTRTAQVTLAPSPRQRLGIGRALLNLNQAERARRLLERVLRTEESQEVYLYIAETLVQLERCQAAAAALEDAPGAPPSAAISRVEFESRLSDLQDAFHAGCGERVLLKCSPAALNLRIDAGSRLVCSPAPIYLSIGPHTVVAEPVEPSEALRTAIRREFNVEPGTTNVVTLNLSRPESIGATGLWGIAAASAGLVIVAGAVALDATVIGPDLGTYNELNREFSDSAELRSRADRLETLQAVDIGLFAVGGGLLAAGTLFLLYDVLDWGDNSYTEPELSWTPRALWLENGGVVGVGGSF